MSQRIVTECDECLAGGETREGHTVDLSALGQSVEVDLCEIHEKPLRDMVLRLAELGRPASASPAMRAICPRCGRAFTTPQALGRHATATHGERVGELRKARQDESGAPAVESPGPFQCPECSRGFGKAQGLAVHRRRTHGVEGSSKATESRRGGSHGDEAHGDG